MTGTPLQGESTDLPGPVERPEADVVIYDGACGFCRSQVERLARWDRRGQLAFVPLQDAWVPQRYPDLTRDRLLREMVLVDRQGNRWGGADAFRYLSRRIPRLWWLVPVMHFPGSMPLWRWVYRQVARHRFRLWSKHDTCEDGQCRLP